MVLRLLSSALILLSFLSVAFAQSDGCKSVAVPVGIVNRNGETFRGLAAADFSGHAGRAVLTLKSMTFDDGPRRVVLVVDTSKKLSADTRKAEQVLVQAILDAARPEDSLGLVTARGPESVVKFGEQRAAFLQALPQEDDSRRGKGTGVLDAAMQALDMFGSAKPGDSIIVIAADLEGNHNTNSRRLAKALQEHGVRMFGLALGPVATENVTLSGQSTTAWGLALATPGIGEIGYKTGDEDFFPLTTNSGGLVLVSMNGDNRRTYNLKDPKFEAFLKNQARGIFNMIATYYRVELEPHPGGWTLEPVTEVRKSIPDIHLLYPRVLGSCPKDSHIARE